MHGEKASPENASTTAVGCQACASAAIFASQSQVAVPGYVRTSAAAP
jgi:hypothetical protein